MSDEAPLDFTGERFTPECVREIWYEHWHRYVFARRLARGKRVLDAACGEGYGAALLAESACGVVGVDVDASAVSHARARYGDRPRLRFERMDATRLDFPDAAFDVVVSFETLEHLEAQEQLVAGFARVLAPGGVLVISSPDKRTYSDLAGFRNEFHVRELYRDQLTALLAPHFAHVRLYGQKLLFQSALWSLDGGDSGSSEVHTAADRAGGVVEGFRYDPLYFVAVCSQDPLESALPDCSLFGDRGESVYTHYNHEIRTNMASGQRIAELEAEVARLRTAAAMPAADRTPAPPHDWRWWRRRRPHE